MPDRRAFPVRPGDAVPAVPAELGAEHTKTLERAARLARSVAVIRVVVVTVGYPTVVRIIVPAAAEKDAVRA